MDASDRALSAAEGLLRFTGSSGGTSPALFDRFVVRALGFAQDEPRSDVPSVEYSSSEMEVFSTVGLRDGRLSCFEHSSFQRKLKSSQ